MAPKFQVVGTNTSALFTLKIHRGEGMALLAMNWRSGKPPKDFVGFGIQYKEPGGDRFFDLKNRLGFARSDGSIDTTKLSTMLSPIQKFRWVHFPRNANMTGDFVYRVTPCLMNAKGEVSYGEAQQAAIELRQETYPGKINVAFTRGFVSSQAFVEKYVTADDGIDTLLPAKADEGLTFEPTHPKADEALPWMGFEARAAVLDVLDRAIADKAEVRVAAYDLSEPEVVTRLVKLKKRLKIIIDDAGDHKPDTSGESQAEQRLIASAGAANVKRQHMGSLQHNKLIVVDGPTEKLAVCGSTNFSWRGFYVQANNAMIVTGANAIKPFKLAFEGYWASDKVAAYGATASASQWSTVFSSPDVKVTFSPHVAANARLKGIADDVRTAASSVFYSLAFLYQTEGPIRDAMTDLTESDDVFVYGISDKEVGGIELQKPDGNLAPVSPSALAKGIPLPFKAEPSAAKGIRMHHKFVVIDFDKPTARVYFGSYNFSDPADTKNGENLLVVRDQRIATSYMVEALRIFDHYHFRISQAEAKAKGKPFSLKRPPNAGEAAWFDEDWTDAHKIRDRKLFA